MKLIREEIEKVEVITEGTGKQQDSVSQDHFCRQKL
jgi:hypothetical protein